MILRDGRGCIEECDQYLNGRPAVILLLFSPCFPMQNGKRLPEKGHGEFTDTFTNDDQLEQEGRREARS